MVHSSLLTVHATLQEEVCPACSVWYPARWHIRIRPTALHPQAYTHILTVACSIPTLISFGPPNVMKNCSANPWRALVSVAFFGSTLVGGLGHDPTDDCLGGIPLVPGISYTEIKCEGVNRVTRRIENCPYYNKFEVSGDHCPACRKPFRNEIWKKVQGCFAHTPVVTLPPRASRM
ncbi:hypothetical protein PCANC_28012 [Puccinia coronata f. sp. avenae]|uniref:Uncharacterized protein n=1 Tax=Puccinia coronata f. sp. avenae TaxID=200324 RepID=A0A2N5S3N0_9BASI|nr:hypothetical protein PCASD_26637 [Puccinia coronata f. sp. avenae]PLW24844.1 hypothetical protein PCANC_28012 [Puccinia coronata f. sp. avenae]